MTDEYKSHLERELLGLVLELSGLIEATLLKSVMSPEPQIFYRKLVGDFYRYLAEVSVPGAAGQRTQEESRETRALLRSRDPSLLFLCRTSLLCFCCRLPLCVASAVLPYSTPALPAAPAVSASTTVPLGFEKKSLDAYQVAMRLASTHLEATHPTRLGLCLNYSVLLYEVLK